MLKSVFAAIIFVTSVPCLARQQVSIDSLETIAGNQNRKINELWGQQAYPQALELLRELVDMPRMNEAEGVWPGILYNVTCAHSLLGNIDSALIYLERSIDAGYYGYQHMGVDSDLDSLRSEPRFEELVAKARRASEFWNSPSFATQYQDTLSDAEKLAGLSKLWMEVKLNFVFFDQIPDLDWDSLYKVYIPKVQQTTTTLEYVRVLQEMCSFLKDGHTGVTPPRELWPKVWGKTGIRTALVEDKVLVTRIANDSLCQEGVEVGMEVLAIDGVPVIKYAEEFIRPYVSTSTPQGMAAQLYTYQLLDGDKETPVKVTLRNALNDTLELILPRDDNSPYLPLTEFRMLEGNIAYFNIRTFSSDTIVTIFDSHFDEIQSSNGLVIDLRKNGGGNSGVGWRILGYLTDTVLTTLKSANRTYSALRRHQGLKEMWETDLWTHPANGEKLYTGPVVMLSGSFTGSAAEDLLVAFDYIDRGLIIGEPSFGSTGQPMSFSLPGGVWARVCIKKCQYPDGKEFVGVGVQPDILVKPTVQDIRQVRDPVLEEAVKQIEGH